MQIILQVPIGFEGVSVEVGGAEGIVIDVAVGGIVIEVTSRWVVLVVFIFQK